MSKPTRVVLSTMFGQALRPRKTNHDTSCGARDSSFRARQCSLRPDFHKDSCGVPDDSEPGEPKNLANRGRTEHGHPKSC